MRVVSSPENIASGENPDLSRISSATEKKTNDLMTRVMKFPNGLLLAKIPNCLPYPSHPEKIFGRTLNEEKTSMKEPRLGTR